MARRRNARKPLHGYDVDAHIGRTIRELRLKRGIGPTALGKILGVSFQQVHLYEGGTTRLSPIHLEQIAAVLGVPIDDLFKGLPVPRRTKGRGALSDAVELNEFANSREGRELIEAFQNVRAPAQRRSILNLVRLLGARSTVR